MLTIIIISGIDSHQGGLREHLHVEAIPCWAGQHGDLLMGIDPEDPEDVSGFYKGTVCGDTDDRVWVREGVLPHRGLVSPKDIILIEFRIVLWPCHQSIHSHVYPFEHLIPHGMFPDKLIHLIRESLGAMAGLDNGEGLAHTETSKSIGRHPARRKAP